MDLASWQAGSGDFTQPLQKRLTMGYLMESSCSVSSVIPLGL